ncbi:MAG TPA: hypothetical protein VLH79_03480 [Chthonomonadales bacterium]|nr:hypothetical protein [Chthonomonadales bacterium]
MTKAERAEMYREYLASEGFPVNIDRDGVVAFKFEGGNYVILIDEDETYFRLVYPGFWSIDSEEERLRVSLAALHATAQVKVAKVYPRNDDTHAAIESFCSPPEAFKPVFKRSLRALGAAVQCFREKVPG